MARELDLTHANASYHLRQLHAAGLLVVAEEASIRLHEAARPPRTPGTVRTSATIALFEMDPDAR